MPPKSLNTSREYAYAKSHDYVKSKIKKKKKGKERIHAKYKMYANWLISDYMAYKFRYRLKCGR